MERVVFVQHVLTALAHLGDPPSLWEHPLGPLLLPGLAIGDRGVELARLLSSAIDLLQPAGTGEAHLAALRRYQYLDRRYRQGSRAAQVAQDLGLSERQARRIQQEAVEALAAVIWSQRANRSAPGVASEPRRRRADEVAGPATVSELDAEVTRIGATPSQSGASLVATLRGALVTIEPLAHQRGVHLDVETPGVLPPIAIDRAVLRQILVNILVAAIQHGARRVTVGAEALSDAAQVTLVVRLRGAVDGQADNPLGDDESLHVARRLLQLQSGTVEVRSIDGVTVAIRLELPVLQPAPVLLVDDNPDTLRLFRRYLNGGAFRPIDATSGRQALELARQVRPRVIVLDVMLPNQDGWEVLQSLKHDWETEAIPVVICSVLQQRELALSLGAADFLEKPISRDSLLLALERHLASPGARPGPSE